MQITGTIEKIETSSGKSERGEWTRWVFIVNGKKYSTFDKSLADNFKEGDNVTMDLEQKGKFTNLVSMSKAVQNTQSTPSNDFQKKVIELLEEINKGVKAMKF